VTVLAALVFTVVVVGFWKVDWVLPDTAERAYAISTLCHPPEESLDTQKGKVRYDVIGTDIDATASCSFSLLSVRPLDSSEEKVCYGLIERRTEGMG